MSDVLVTGATGALGTHVIKDLLNSGKSVIAVSHKRQLNISHPSLKTVQLNLWDQKATAELLNACKPNQLIHLAWEATPGQFWLSSNNFDWISSSSHLLQEFIENGGTRVVLAGTCAEYKWGLMPLDEDTSTLNPTTIYSASKAAFHTLANAICRDISLAWGRVFFPYSPSEDKKRLVRYIADTVKAGDIPNIGVPDRAIDLIHIEDVAQIFSKLTESSITGPVNICSGTSSSPYDVCRIFAKLCGHRDLEKRFTELSEKTIPTTSVVGSTKKLETLIPLSSLKSLEQGFTEFL